MHRPGGRDDGRHLWDVDSISTWVQARGGRGWSSGAGLLLSVGLLGLLHVSFHRAWLGLPAAGRAGIHTWAHAGTKSRAVSCHF